MLFVATGASKWGKPKEFPWTMGYQPDYHTEAVIYAKHILANVKDAKIAVLMQNDDYGKDYWEGFKEGLGKEAGRIVKHVTYEVTDPTVDSQVIQLKDSGANVFFNISIPKFAAQSMRKAAEIGWKPVQYLNNVSGQVTTTMKPAGFENVQGVITAAWLKDPTDKQWDGDAEMKTWREWMAKYMPGANLGDVNYVYAYSVSFLMEQTLKKCGDNLTRENLMKQAANHQKLRVPGLLPGITVSDQPDRLLPGPGCAIAALQGRVLGAVRRDPVGRKQLVAAATCDIVDAEGRLSGGLLFCSAFGRKLRATLQWEEIKCVQAGVVSWVAYRRWPWLRVRLRPSRRRSTTTG